MIECNFDMTTLYGSINLFNFSSYCIIQFYHPSADDINIPEPLPDRNEEVSIFD